MTSSIKPPASPAAPVEGVEAAEVDVTTEATVSATEQAGWQAALEATDGSLGSSAVDMQGLPSIQSTTIMDGVVIGAMEAPQLAELGDEDLAVLEQDLRDALESDPTVRTLFEEQNRET
jgi:hypothetical protein